MHVAVLAVLQPRPQALNPGATCLTGRLSLSFEEPLSLRSAAPAPVVDAMKVAISMENPFAGGRDSTDGLIAPWRPRGILVRLLPMLPQNHIPKHGFNVAMLLS